MKIKILYLFLLALPFFSCEEIPPTVTGSTGNTGGGGNSNVEDQKRQVLVEEFTGVRCIQCPSGSAIIEDLLAVHGEQLIAVSIHAGEFSPPYPQSVFDFRTMEGDLLINFLGQPFGYPSAVVNRKLFQDQFDLQLGKDEWAGYIDQEKQLEPQIKIDIQPTYNQATRDLEVEVILYVEESILDPDVRLSVMITENNVPDHQLTPDSSPATQADYKHKHVLRDMITAYDGDPITDALVEGAVITRNLTFKLDNDWVAENCSIVAFVNLGGTVKIVLQAHEVHVIE